MKTLEERLRERSANPEVQARHVERMARRKAVSEGAHRLVEALRSRGGNSTLTSCELHTEAQKWVRASRPVEEFMAQVAAIDEVNKVLALAWSAGYFDAALEPYCIAHPYDGTRYLSGVHMDEASQALQEAGEALLADSFEGVQLVVRASNWAPVRPEKCWVRAVGGHRRRPAADRGADVAGGAP